MTDYTNEMNENEIVSADQIDQQLSDNVLTPQGIAEAFNELTRLRAENAALKANVERYKWWRENIGWLEEDSLGGAAFDCQCPRGLLESGTPGQLMDYIADFELAQGAAASHPEQP